MEFRGRIADSAAAKVILEQNGAKKTSDYQFEDRIYFLPGKTSLEEGFVRIRSPSPEMNDKRFRVVKKVMHAGELMEMYRSFFPDLTAAKQALQGHWLACILARKGSAYQIGNGKIFLEEIEEFGPAVEAEFQSEKDGREWLEKIHATEISPNPLPLRFMLHQNGKKKT